MPSVQGSLNASGGITLALLQALDAVQKYAAASQIGPNGKPSGTAVYMHLPMGIPIDPKMYANAWTPGGGDAASSFSDDGTFAQPAAAPAAAAPAPAASTAPPPGVPDGAVYPPPQPQPDQQLAQSIQNAMYTASLVDNMLEISKDGIAVAWPDRRVSIEYYDVLQGIQPATKATPNPEVVARVKAAQAVLYVQDAKGNFVGYTPLYAQYKKNRKAWTDAVAAQAAAYWQAMADPIAGRAWPVAAATYANTVKQTYNDFTSMGRHDVEAALNIIATVGQDAVTALVALGKELYDAYAIQLGGAVSVGVPWSYINPISWWDHTDEAFGIQKLTVKTSEFRSSGAGGAASFASNWHRQQSSSTSGSAGISFGLAKASANASHADASNAFGDKAHQSDWKRHEDKSSNATIYFEFFVAQIERPWLLGDIFHLQGWYLTGQKKNSISDGTIDGQLDDNTKLLPMLPKAFVIMRNVTITADEWGDAASDFMSAQQDMSGSGQSSSNAYGGSVGYLGIAASGQHAKQQSSDAFGADQSAISGFTFNGDKKHGVLQLLGSQIVGWIGEIQPAAPAMDDPMLPKEKPKAQTTDAAA